MERPVLDCWIPYDEKTKVAEGRYLATYRVIGAGQDQKICVGFLWWETRTVGNFFSSQPKIKTGWFCLNGGFEIKVIAWCLPPAPYKPR